MEQKNRIRICGHARFDYDEIIELSDEGLKGFRNRLNLAKKNGDQGIDNCLGEDYGDAEPIDREFSNWSAELIDDNDSIIEHLDCLE